LKESEQSMDVDAFLERARALWNKASSSANRGRVELYAKTSLRIKVTRDLSEADVTIDRAHESGLAVRTSHAGQDRSGFAAASGLSDDVVTWATTAANNSGAQVTAAAPGPKDSVPVERRDLDANVPLPTPDELTECLLAHPDADWVEAGTTLEVLVGAHGWVAVRRRNRFWALTSERWTGLLVQRGLRNWELLLDRSEDLPAVESHPNSLESTELVLLPDGAAVIVAALAESLREKDPSEWVDAGKAWEVVDDPLNSLGLAGGSFDDVGFPADSRVLATGGLWVGGPSGPGTFHRPSFREPPTESASNLVVAPGPTKPLRGLVAPQCRVLRLSASQWVLELQQPDGPRWLRTGPGQLLAACADRMGGARATPAGPIVPALRFEGLRTE
jgi:hypothetical protein